MKTRINRLDKADRCIIKNIAEEHNKTNIKMGLSRDFFVCLIMLLFASLPYNLEAFATEIRDEIISDHVEYSVSFDYKMTKITSPNYVIHILMDGFRYQFLRPNGDTIVPNHENSGLQFGSVSDIDLTQSAPDLDSLLKGRSIDVVTSRYIGRTDDKVTFEVINTIGDTAIVGIIPGLNRVRLSVSPKKEGLYAITGRTGGISPVFGLADHGGLGRTTTDVTGFTSEYFGARTAPALQHLEGRLISNFIIAPRIGFATVNVEPRKKIVRVLHDENAQGSSASREMTSLYYFFGDPKTIYHEFLDVRNLEGYPFMKPKYAMFGVGWEAFGALGWTTSAKTVEENIRTYLDLGYPLKWMVIGSGFWPGHKPELWGTTSFGMWNKDLYPDPKAFINYFKDKGLTVLLGLRIAFKQGNPFALEAESNGFLITDNDGKPVNFQDRGRGETYLLDFENPEAVQWYVDKCQLWMDYGVDGFKEDLMFFLNKLERDDKVDPVNQALMKRGVYIMGRNMYLGSPVDLHRFNDFNFYESQDRGPINGLAFGYSGYPYVYPDIVGGTKVWEELEKNNVSEDLVANYMMRYAQYASVHPSMAFGYGPWSLNRLDVIEVTRNAANLHNRLHPYIYSYAIEAYNTGFPYTFTPLPLAYPDDESVYQLANTERRSYQWLLGESLMATPLYGDDFATSQTRHIYLPEGAWIDYDNGQKYVGPKTLYNYYLPVDKTPLFVGGKGILIEEYFERMFAHIYPIKQKTSMKFNFKDGGYSEIFIDVQSWENDLTQVINLTTETIITADIRNGIIIFPLEKGCDYLVQSIKIPEPVRLLRPSSTNDLPD